MGLKPGAADETTELLRPSLLKIKDFLTRLMFSCVLVSKDGMKYLFTFTDIFGSKKKCLNLKCLKWLTSLVFLLLGKTFRYLRCLKCLNFGSIIKLNNPKRNFIWLLLDTGKW